ncbi:MAG: VOC family protein [Phenylobacterium sp.]|uniref:VOC family protein n=1 Tax=Phenylobacterium sp. TaxID=1871053 RepID=UPI00391C3D7E
MPKMIFVNLPVADLAAATSFYAALGCEKNDQFSDENASSMVWSEAITFMLLTRDYFSTFLTRPVADAQSQTGVLVALSRDTRAEVDAVVEAGAAAGGKADARPPMDMGFMYNRQVEDPDGHVLEFVWMDMAGFEAANAPA